MRTSLIIGCAMALALCGLARARPSATHSLRIVNDSNAEIHEIHYAWTHTGRWGPDMLGKQVLKPHAAFVIGNVSAGDYDILFVNTGGHSCVAGPVSVYANVTWVLTDRNCRQN